VGPTGPTLSDSAVLANGSNETGSLVFTLTGPIGFSYTQTDPVSGNSAYSASDTLPTTAAPGAYTWSVSYAGDANNFGASDQGGTAEQTVVVGPGATIVGNSLYLVGGNTNDHLKITPIGASDTGSTGINVNGNLNHVDFKNQTYTGVTTIFVTGFGGNDKFQFASSLTIATVVSDGDGNDQIRLGNGNNTVTVGDGNDKIKAGDGANTITAGAAGSTGNIQVQLGNGAGNIVTLYGNGNDQVQVGDGNNDSVSITGDGNDQIEVGNGLGDVVSMVGNGNNDVRTGSGSGRAHLSGSGHISVHLGSSGWQLI
jgi:hypothetical protein